MKPLEIVIADDHPLVLDGLKLILASHPDIHVVGCATRGEEACRQAALLKPDVVLLDVFMPGLGGAGATKRIKDADPDIQVLAISAFDEEAYIRQILAYGASGYILKKLATADIAQAIRTVGAGGMYLDPAIAGRVSASREVKTSQVLSETSLSGREKEILLYTARGFSNKEIANLLLVSVKTVETYKARSCRKLKLESRSEIVQYALAQGWLQSASTYS